MNLQPATSALDDAAHPGMTWIPGGKFRMGSEDFYREERPVHEVTVDGFWIDCYEVTNNQFARFADETGLDRRCLHRLARPSRTSPRSTGLRNWRASPATWWA